MNPRTMYRKIWESHLVREALGEPSLIYIDRHLVHEVTSPQAFAGLKTAGRKVRRPDLTVATMDHNVPTRDRDKPIADPIIICTHAQTPEAILRPKHIAERDLQPCAELGATLASGLALGIF